MEILFGTVMEHIPSTYRLDFTLKKDTSNYALKNFEFRDLLDASDIRTDPKALPYISYDRDSCKFICENR